MANVAKFNREDVIRKAMLLFWEKGFNGASTRDLQQAIDMRPGSIYAAFGSKEKLYSEALECYSKEMSDILMRHIAEQRSPLAGLERFFQNVVVDQRDSNPSEVCMLVKTLSEVNEQHPDLLQLSRELLKRTEDRFTDILQLALKQGELAGHPDPRMIAKQLQVQMIGLRIYMKTSGNMASVSELIAGLFKSISTRSDLN
ncbi:transcriptional regulator, TetR family [Amphritea atlantica]|uniref:Transcriptional regulator, TetR family n=1 Tax=Amphritea atlantica TaxID=355243 RepID=A0A1H9KYR0_9GAMM|nr:TetR/AcrR family transcriptional regulator [Amphritea atlantica]SER04300.1 transcriptional regulator, TetR family [Amphritea atlantica]